MGNCIICGASADGHICSSHEEDVVFTFEGNRANQLKPGRYYEGSVDGFAEFGVFVDIGTSVTGLLHRSELDRRLDSLDWDAGDSVYVQVTDIRDNGNVDLGWSIRQRESDFRGKLVQTPEGDELPDEPDEADEPDQEKTEPVAAGGNAGAKQKVRTPDADDAAPATTESDTTEEAPSEGEAEGSDETADATDAVDDTEPSTAAETDDTEDHSELARSTVDSVTDLIGQVVRIEGEIISVRQTSGPTVFEIRDETGVVEVAAFEEAGVRAYPDVEVDDVVRLEGEVERHHDEVQIETEVLTTLEDEDASNVADRMDAALDEQADPGSVDLLADHDAVTTVADEIRDVATEIRRAVIQGRPVVVRHTATADGYVAGAAIERAVLPLVAAEHERQDAQYHFCERRPLDDTVYGMDAATDDVTDMLDARERHGEQLPLVVLVDLGSTLESREGYELLDVYGAECLVVDSGYPDDEVVDDLGGIVDPHLAGDVTDVTTSALAANVAAHVNSDVRDDLAHLPAVSYWQDTPEAYIDLASEAGYTEDDTDELREAVGLEAFYQSYKDKRELITDILFEEADGLAGHVSEQFRTKLDRELQTARRNLSTRSADGVEFAILDADAFSNRFDFPPTELLLDALHRSEAAETDDDDLVTLGLDEDELHIRSTSPIDVRTVGDEIAAQVDGGGVSVVGGRDGHVEFLAGERDAVLNAAVAEIANSFA
ncbi:OB-fold nucleic acid binding domain-containing protein [Haloarchaeobius sp. FL176]|uniref:OB-fold nucleic acid binding domain-containing protein n=1 Tax=Haloarchaeobius sp. FL176 TaxID=2967129 RepID=UPI0021487F0E|nr:OB-fold nucleic acid binding domain-containing protein [Haloarchaeobius sp. FL176]